MRPLTLFLVCLLCGGLGISANAQTTRLQTRETEWKNYSLPQTNFARHAVADNKIIFRAPADWEEDRSPGVLRFSGPHSSSISVLVQDVPDGSSLGEYVGAVLQGLRNLPGATESTFTRRTQFQDLEAREVLIEAPEPGGEMTRSTSWLTIVGPLAVTFNLQVPLAHAAAVEPFFKATVQSVIFVSERHEKFAALRESTIKTPAPAPVNEVESIVATLNELNSDRESAINRLAPIFSSTPDAVLDLLLDRRATVRSAAVAALVRSKNAALKPFLWHALEEADPLVAEAAARAVAQEPDVVSKLLSRSTSKDTLEIAARIWPYLTTENHVKILNGIFNPTGPPNLALRHGALTLLHMLPPADFKLPLARGMAANDEVFTKIALQIASYRGESLPVDSLLKLASSRDERIKKLAIENLGQSGVVADIPRIESLKGLGEERRLAINKIRFRHELNLSKSPEERREIIQKAASDSSLADFAWRFDCEATAGGCTPANAKPLPPEFTVKTFAENLLPKRLRHYTAIPNPAQAVERFYETLNGLQLDSPRAQSTLTLLMGTFRQRVGHQLGAPANAPALIDYTGIKPDAPIVMASWTAAGAHDTTAMAQRQAIVLRVKDRERFERVVHNLQETNRGSLLSWIVDYVGVGSRLVPAFPAILTVSAKEFVTSGRTKEKTVPMVKYSFIGQTEWNGIPIKTIEYRSIDARHNFEGARTCLAFIGDTVILAPDVATIRDLLTNATAGEEQLLAGNEEFRRSVASDGDVVYFSDLNSVFPTEETKEPRAKANESGALKFSNSTWENAHRLALDESDWSKPLAPFHPKELTAPRELLPASTLAYYLMKVDVAAAFETWVKIIDEFKSAADVWALDFKAEVLPELGPECGVALFELPELSLSGGSAVVFCKLRSSKLSEALTNGKLFRGVGPTTDVAEVKSDDASYFVTSKNGFMIVSNQRKGLTALADKTNLASTRDYSRAAEKAPSGIVAFGGYNLEAAIAAVNAAVGDGFKAQQAAMVFSVTSAFHSQSFYATATPSGIEGRSSVAMDREGRYAVADLSYLPQGANITLAAIEARGAPITDQKRVSSLVLKIRAKAAGPIDSIREDIKTAHQTVEQKSANELLVTIAARHGDPEKKIQLPVTDPSLAQFLKASGDIASDDQRVIARAKEIAGDDRDAWSVARKLSHWTHENLQWKHVASAGAAQTLASREADCSEFSELFVALARSLGLPARTVSGLAHAGSTFGGHAWVEVWVGEWIEMDPTWGTDFVDATHIRNTSSALVTSAALNLIEVEVLETRRAVAEFQKTPKALAEHLIKAIPEGDRSEIEAATDLETLTDEYMGAGAWKGLNESEREQMSSAYRRVLGEIVAGYRKEFSYPNAMHLLRVEEKGDRAEVWCLDTMDDMLVKFRFVQRGGAWQLVEMVQADSNLHIAAEIFSPAIKSIESARSGKRTAAGLSDLFRALALFTTDPVKASEVIERAVQAKPSDQNLRYIKALSLMMLEKHDEGVKLLTELSKEQPAHAPAIFKLAESLSEDKVEEAIDLYKRYTLLEPFDPRGYRELGALFEISKQLSLAEDAYRKHIASDPIELSAYLTLIRLLALNDRIGEVSAVMATADPLVGPDDDLMAEVLDELWADVELADAQKLADIEAKRMKNSMPAHIALATLYMRDEQYRAALTLINRAIQIAPKASEPRALLSRAYLELSRFADAMKAANQAVSLDQESAAAHFQRARILARLGRSKEAISALEKALELDPEVADWVTDDPHLKSLKSLRAFKKLFPEEKPPAEPK